MEEFYSNLPSEVKSVINDWAKDETNVELVAARLAKKEDVTVTDSHRRRARNALNHIALETV